MARALGGKVELWTRRLVLDVDSVDQALSILSSDERRRADSFRIATARNRFIGRHAHLREVLAVYLDDEPGIIPLVSRLNEPPRLDVPSDLRLSLSSSDDVSVVAIAHERAVGVDIERLDREVDMNAVAAAVFSPRECQAIKSVFSLERQALFFRIWTRKEAFVKALGVGFQRDFKSFDVVHDIAAGPDGTKAVVDDHQANDDSTYWLVQDIAGLPDFALACCAEGSDWTFELKRDQPEAYSFAS